MRALSALAMISVLAGWVPFGCAPSGSATGRAPERDAGFSPKLPDAGEGPPTQTQETDAGTRPVPDGGIASADAGTEDACAAAAAECGYVGSAVDPTSCGACPDGEACGAGYATNGCATPHSRLKWLQVGAVTSDLGIATNSSLALTLRGGELQALAPDGGVLWASSIPYQPRGLNSLLAGPVISRSGRIAAIANHSYCSGPDCDGASLAELVDGGWVERGSNCYTCEQFIDGIDNRGDILWHSQGELTDRIGLWAPDAGWTLVSHPATGPDTPYELAGARMSADGLSALAGDAYEPFELDGHEFGSDGGRPPLLLVRDVAGKITFARQLDGANGAFTDVLPDDQGGFTSAVNVDGEARWGNGQLGGHGRSYVVRTLPDGADGWATALPEGRGGFKLAGGPDGRSYVLGHELCGFFVEALEPDGAPSWIQDFPLKDCRGYAEPSAIAVAPWGEVLVGGSFFGVVDFGAGWTDSGAGTWKDFLLDLATTERGRDAVVAIARFDGTTGNGGVPDTESFDGSASHSSDPTATMACAWSFGDGSSVTGCRASHTFERAGNYHVLLTATDSDGASGTAALEVHVRRPGGVHWVRAGGGGGIGTDFQGAAVSAAGSVLERFDPFDGHTIWQRSFGDPNEGQPYAFQGPAFLSPAGDTAFAVHTQGYPPYHSMDACPYASADGTAGQCFAGVSLEVGGIGSFSMGAGGEVATGTSATFRESATVRKTDGSTWSVDFWLRSDGQFTPDFVLGEVTAEPGGDLIAAGSAKAGFTFDGKAIGPGEVLLRISEGGKLVWWRALPGKPNQLATSALGTIVAVVDAPAGFTWSGQSVAAGQQLLTIERDGSDRWARALPAGDAGLAVLPAGKAAVYINRADCSGPELDHYDLAGDLLDWELFQSMKCDGAFVGIAILPYDVLLSGRVAHEVDFGVGRVSGPFLLDMGQP